MSREASRAPTASIIISAYNRADVLRHAVKSVIRSTYADWELLVVGDHCTDHSEKTVQSFADPRITFQNLPQNSGGQWTPHNVGIAQARGRYVLFLNQDDMYCADHVARAVAHMEETGADISWSPFMVLEHSGRSSGPPDAAHDRVLLQGVVHDGQYDARLFLVSSCWIVKREVCASVGPWKSADETFHSPSQEWLFRAWRAGSRFSFQPHPSVLCVHSGAKRLSYLRRSPEHDRAWTWIADEEGASAALLRCISMNHALRAHQHTIQDGLLRALAEVVKSKANTIAQRFGVQPFVLRSWLTRQRKGDVVARWRVHTMEADRLAAGRLLQAGDAAGDGYFADGWQERETSGRRTSGRSADIIFQIGPADTGHLLELTGHTLTRPGIAIFSVNGQARLEHRYTSGEETVRIDLGILRGNVKVSVQVDDPTSPQRLNMTVDGQALGLWVSSIELIPVPVATPAAGEEPRM